MPKLSRGVSPKKTIALRLPDALIEALAREEKRTGETRTQIVERLLKKGLTMEKEDFGSYEIDGTTWALKQHPYIAGTHDEPRYEAAAISEDGSKETIITWDVDTDIAQPESDIDGVDWDAGRVGIVYKA